MTTSPKPPPEPASDVDIVFLVAVYDRAQRCGMSVSEYLSALSEHFIRRGGMGCRDLVPGAHGTLAEDGNPFRDLPTLIQRYLIARFPEGAALRVPAANWTYGKGFKPPKPPTNAQGDPDFSGLSFLDILKYLPTPEPGSVGPRDPSFPETTEDRDRRLINQAVSDRKQGASWETIQTAASRETGLSLSQLGKIFQSEKEAERRTRDQELRRKFREHLEIGVPSGEAVALLARKFGLSARQIQAIVTRRSKPDK